MYKNGLMRKLWLISKFMTWQTGHQITAIHILSKISRSRGNQTIRFGHLVEYNMENNFLKKSYPKCGGETISRPFYKNSKLSISLDRESEMFIAWKVSVMGVFLVRIFPHYDWIRTDTPYLSVFSLNAGKYEPEKLRIWILLTQWL